MGLRLHNKPSFGERIMLLKRTTEDLRDLSERRTQEDVSAQLRDPAETVMSEVLHMEAAQARFEARTPARLRAKRKGRAARLALITNHHH
jgi:hypothetical protein